MVALSTPPAFLPGVQIYVAMYSYNVSLLLACVDKVKLQAWLPVGDLAALALVITFIRGAMQSIPLEDAMYMYLESQKKHDTENMAL